MKNYFQAPWDLRDIAIVIFTSLTLYLTVALGLHIAPINDLVGLNKTLGSSLAILLQWIIVFIPISFVSINKKGLTRKNLGVNKVKAGKLVKEIILAYLTYFLISATIASLLLYFEIELPGYQQAESILPIFGSDLFSLVVAGILIAIIGPIMEEIIFRGFLFRTLANQLGYGWGSCLSALIFTILHYPWVSVIPIFILAIIMNHLVYKTKSIVTSALFHIFNNSIAFAFQLLIMNGVIEIS